MPPEHACEPGLTWFIYYRVDPSCEATVIEGARRLIALAAASCPGLHGQLMRRPAHDTPGGELTMMEIYRLPPTLDVLAVSSLRRTLEESANALLGPELARQRHVEVFEPCA
ncbi:MAG: DUF4936 family protein [Burkholderiales bacterium]|nr:DUF4936 family protein [Burkholderiales bacterium]